MVKRPLTRIAYSLGLACPAPPQWRAGARFWPHPCYPWPALDTLEPPPSTALLSAEEAKERLREIVEGFFFRRLRGEGGKQVGRLLVKSPPGLGKTREAVRLGRKREGLAQIGLDSCGLAANEHVLSALQADARLAIGKPEDVKRQPIGTPDRHRKGTPHRRWGRLVPVANRRVPRASRSALTSDGAARVGGAAMRCSPSSLVGLQADLVDLAAARGEGTHQLCQLAPPPDIDRLQRNRANTMSRGPTRQPSHPALRRPSTRWAWSSGRNHGTRFCTYILNAAGATEMAFSSHSFASAVRPSWPSAAAGQR